MVHARGWQRSAGGAAGAGQHRLRAQPQRRTRHLPATRSRRRSTFPGWAAVGRVSGPASRLPVVARQSTCGRRDRLFQDHRRAQHRRRGCHAHHGSRLCELESRLVARWAVRGLRLHQGRQRGHLHGQHHPRRTHPPHASRRLVPGAELVPRRLPHRPHHGRGRGTVGALCGGYCRRQSGAALLPGLSRGPGGLVQRQPAACLHHSGWG